MTWIIVFISSCGVLFWSGSRLVNALSRIARYLGWREFVVAFFIIAVAGSLPNLFVGVNSVLQGVPELSFGEIVGGNLIDMTLAVALAVLISGNNISVRSKMVQTSTVFTAAIALLPLLLALDGNLGRADGLVLLLAFGIYVFWLFSKEENFSRVYKLNKKKPVVLEEKIIFRFKSFMADLARSLFYMGLILLASAGAVKSAVFFAGYLGVGLPIIGILIIGLGNALPETYFSIVSAKKGHTWMILGDLMGSVIICSTFVLGLVVLIAPIEVSVLRQFAIGRFFLVISALFFMLFIKTDKKITRSEAALLLAIYFIFVFAELAFQ